MGNPVIRSVIPWPPTLAVRAFVAALGCDGATVPCPVCGIEGRTHEANRHWRADCTVCAHSFFTHAWQDYHRGDELPHIMGACLICACPCFAPPPGWPFLDAAAPATLPATLAPSPPEV